MTIKNKSLPQIKSRLKRILARENLTLFKKIKEGSIKGRFFKVVCLKNKKEKVFFKALLADNQNFRNALVREIKTMKILNHHPALKNLKTTSYLKGNIKGDLPWYIRRFIKGKSLGEFYEIAKEFEKKDYATQIIRNLKVLQKSPNIILFFKKKGYQLENRNFEAYLWRVKDFQNNIGQKRGRIDFKKIYAFYKKNEKVFKKYPLVLAQGDFTIANQLITDSGVLLIDWEWLRIDNLTADFCHLWIQSWRYQNWQKKLLKNFINSFPKSQQKDVKIIFSITIIEQALAEIRWNSEICKRKYKKPVRKYSLKIIRQALQGFKYLL